MDFIAIECDNAVKGLIHRQAQEIAELKRQLEKYHKTDSDSLIYSASEETESLTASPPLSLVSFPDVQPLVALKLVLPTKQTFKKRIKAAIELDGYNCEVHFQHLLYEDAKLPSSSKQYRWNFGFRFCAYFVHSGKKILVKTLVNGIKKKPTNSKLLSVQSFPGLHEFLVGKNVDVDLLEKPLSEEATTFFSIDKQQQQILKFLYAFCAFLYSFLPKQKRAYQIKGNVSGVCLSAATSRERECSKSVTLAMHEIKQEEDESPDGM